MAYTRTITNMGEDIMMDMVELCTILMTNERPDNHTTKDNKPTYNAEGDNHQNRGQRQQIHNLQHLDNGGERPRLAREGELPATPQSEPARRGETSKGGESCTRSMYARMPRPISWASQGGRAPTEQVYKDQEGVLDRRDAPNKLYWQRQPELMRD
jgi:hypothetical protein